MSYEFDDIDRRIIHALERDARNTSAPDIAEEMDVSPGTVRNRIGKLEDAGVIRGYHADVDYERVEGRLTNVITATASASERAHLAQQALDVPGVVQVREVMSGRGNLAVKVVGTDTEDLSRLARKLTNVGLDIEDEALLQDEHYRPYGPFGPNAADDASREPFGHGTDDEVIAVTVEANAPLDGKTLQEANEAGLVGENVLVVAVEREGATITPKGDTTLRADDLVKVYSSTSVPTDTLEAFRA
ncbi:winged helix-turn-helix transcriptional regulator [Salarchaeum sp. III]|uniref:Lrp/AsnC family transcriptional regulator n=1 Tax=Salarchaeum sp. III TaxID=3107927 RepID=UPI002ED81F18